MVIAKIWEKYERNERLICSAAIIIGFIFDNMVLSRVDYTRDEIVFTSYLTILAVAIGLLNLLEDGYLKSRFWKNSHTGIMFVIQFFFGGIFSSSVVLYGRSASLFSSWIFILILAALLVSNELIKKHYARMTLHMSIYFLGIYLCMIFLLPALIGRIGYGMFILSGAVTVLLFGIFLYILYRFVPDRIRADGRQLAVSVTAIFLLVNLLYFTGTIPPLPLSLKGGSVYHSIVRDSAGDFLAEGEVPPWYSILQAFERIHIVKGDPVFIATTLYAPARFEGEVVHEWNHFDESSNSWVFVSRVEFPVSGGRDEGFRGYSEKENVAPGLWRVDIKTPNGQNLGSVRFKVVETSKEPALVSENL